jgi:eukaryotic-like serine/threonine-protein kinase
MSCWSDPNHADDSHRWRTSCLVGDAMSCPSDSVFKQLAADQLPPEVEQQIAEHLETCATCRQRTAADIEFSNGDATQKESLDGDRRRSPRNEADGWAPPTEEPTAELFRLLTAEPTDDVTGTKLSHFIIRRWLGCGSFGVVFLAYDQLLHREVALKLPRIQPLVHREARERFLREAEAAAKLHHPNVVPVYEAGQEHGICFIASSYCSGPTLATWLDQQSEPVSIATAIGLVRQLAEAVQHAHEQRVLHRDIKPSNILLETDLAAPHAVTPMITDFGLAKLLDTRGVNGAVTASQGMLGTPHYMAPEQAGGNHALIGPATDVFALGAILYELLVGVAPYAGEDPAATLHRLIYDRVTPPRRLRRDVPRDLEAIGLKCLEKKPEDRYRTAQELADDLRHFEQGQATQARPIGRLEMLRRWTVRQPAIASLLALTAIGLLSLLAIFVAYSRSLESFNEEMKAALQDTRQAQQALATQRTRLSQLLFVSKIELAHQAIKENDLQQASRLLTEARTEAPDAAGGFVWRYLWSQVVVPGELIDNSHAGIYDLKFSPSGKRFATCGADSILRIYHGDHIVPLVSMPTAQGEVNGVTFSPDDQLVATTGDDGTVRIWETLTGDPKLTIESHDQVAYGVLFTPDGATLISCGNEPTIRLWDVATGAPRGTLQGHSDGVEAITLSPDGKQLASASSDHTVRLWNIASKKSAGVLAGHTGRVIDVVYSGDGKYLLTGSIDHTIRLWRIADGKCVQIEHHVDPITSVAFFAGDSQFATADRGGSLHLWQRNPREPPDDPASTPSQGWKAHHGRAWEVTTTPDQTGILSAGADGQVYLWKRLPKSHQSLELPDNSEIMDVAMDPIAARLYFIDSESTVRSWDIASGRQSTLFEPRMLIDRQPLALCMLPERQMILAFSDGTVERIDLPSRTKSLRLRIPWDAPPDWRVDHLSASRDGRRVAIFSYARDATLVYDLPQARLIGSFAAYAQGMTLSDDGTRLAMSDGDDVVVWNVDLGKRIARFRGHTSSVVSLQFSPDGNWLASGSKDRHVRLWHLEERREPVVFTGHRDEVTAVAFSPDGRLLASGDQDGELKFWFLAESAELISIEGSAAIGHLAFSPSGDHLAVQTQHQIHVYQAAVQNQ